MFPFSTILSIVSWAGGQEGQKAKAKETSPSADIKGSKAKK